MIRLRSDQRAQIARWAITARKRGLNTVSASWRQCLLTGEIPWWAPYE